MARAKRFELNSKIDIKTFENNRRAKITFAERNWVGIVPACVATAYDSINKSQHGCIHNLDEGTNGTGRRGMIWKAIPVQYL